MDKCSRGKGMNYIKKLMLSGQIKDLKLKAQPF